MMAFTKLSIITLNVNGIRNDLDRMHLFRNLISTQANIFLLQETHSIITDRHRWTDEWREISDGGNIYFSHSPQSDSRGAAILTNGSFNHRPIEQMYDQNGRIITLILETHDIRFQIINIYAPNTEKDDFYTTLDPFVDPNSFTIIGGDFNLVLNNSLDRIHCAHIPTDGVQAFKDFINSYSLVDPFREDNPDAKVYTWKESAERARARELKLES